MHAERSPKGGTGPARTVSKDSPIARTHTEEIFQQCTEDGKRQLEVYTSKLLSRSESVNFFDRSKDSNWSHAAFGHFFDNAIRAADSAVQVFHCMPVYF